MTLGRVLYRLRKFGYLALTSLSEEERKEVGELLTPAQKSLFYSMGGFGQRHCLNVYHTLVRDGCDDSEVLKAALLHDAGKEGVGIMHRVACVLLQALSPSLLRRLAIDRPGSWRYGLYVNLNHAEHGAALAEAAGAPPLTVELIRLHQSKSTPDTRLLAFQRADEIN